ncbi:MAG: glycosyltransferase family 39 protein [Verrucomicrobiota bacterium]
MPVSTHFRAEPTDTDWVRRGWGLITLVTLFRLAWLWLAPLDLVPDEAYYWDWGRHPAWCYFSKPPMIAWVNTVTQALGFTSAPLIRIPAVVFGTIGLMTTWFLVRRLWGTRAGFFALVLGATSPGVLALNTLLTIDAPLIACWSVALYALWRALELPAADGSRTKWWLLYAVAGLLGVLSKQMMLVLPVLALVFVFTDPAGRRVRPATYGWLAMPLLALIPLLLWNLRHDWITLRHTAHHFEGPPWTLVQGTKFAAEFIGSQLGIIGLVPAVILGMAAGSWSKVRADRRQWFAWTMTIPPLAVLLAMSLRQRVQPNWPAVFLLGGTLLSAGWLIENWPRRRTLWRMAAILGMTFAFGAYTLVMLIEPLGLAAHKLNLTRRLRGWAQLGADVGALKARLEAEGGPPVIVVAHGGRQLASELAFYLPGQPQVWCWTPPGVVDSQYALWPGPLPAWRGARVLLVTSKDELPPGLTGGLGQITPLGEILSKGETALPPRLRIFVGHNLQPWDHGKPLRDIVPVR